MKPTPEKRARWVQCRLSLVGAIPLAIVGGGMTYIDAGNNYAVGAGYLEKLGEALAVAAIVYVLSPIVAAIAGRWNWLTVSSTAVAGVITVSAAYFAYTSQMAAKVESIVERQQIAAAARERRDQAKADIAQAERAMVAAGELLTSAALRDQRGEALARVHTERNERGGCPATVKRGAQVVESECRKAETLAAAILERIGKAELRERAEARAVAARKVLDETRDLVTSEPQQNLAAVDVAAYFDTTPDVAAKGIARAFAISCIILTAILGLMMHEATALFMAAFGIAPLSHRAPQPSGLIVVAPPPPAAKPALPRPAAKSKGRPKKTPKQRIEQFATERLRPAPTVKEQATGAQMHEAFEEWWHVNAPGLRMPDQKLVAEVLKKRGIDKAKRGGKVRWSARIERVEA